MLCGAYGESILPAKKKRQKMPPIRRGHAGCEAALRFALLARESPVNDHLHVVIAIDGPSGVGKSTVARLLAQRLGYWYVDSGAIYRAVGWLAQRSAVLEDAAALLPCLLASHPIDIRFITGRSTVWVDGQDITVHLKGEAVGQAASTVAKLAEVRQFVTARLRQLRCQANLVMEGRDIGTVVFPDATHKFFLEASPQVRGYRRWQEMGQSGHQGTQEEIVAAVVARDHQDRTRAFAPLLRAPEARVIDTTDLAIDEVVQTMVSEIQSKALQDDG